MDLVTYIYRQIKWSARTFGPGTRTEGITTHIRKELQEVEENPTDLYEWVDIIQLALDGAWRAGHSPEDICYGIEAKQIINEGRDWPDWRTVEKGKAIEHIKESVK